jgi:DNA invertase Pin-like site-specific DNA recombinase
MISVCYDSSIETQTEKIMAVYGYIRVSTEGKGQTTDNQRKLIVDAGIAVTEFFSEDGVSGSVKAFERPAFSRHARPLCRR